mmetsp:Transcript_95584/g.276063  ORF Transcript_95584/g.276063 Transcript_95584/m.276063 type:complete len:223 (+) Transcript_95584:1742-2410(+)
MSLGYSARHRSRLRPAFASAKWPRSPDLSASWQEGSPQAHDADAPADRYWEVVAGAARGLADLAASWPALAAASEAVSKSRAAALASPAEQPPATPAAPSRARRGVATRGRATTVSKAAGPATAIAARKRVESRHPARAASPRSIPTMSDTTDVEAPPPTPMIRDSKAALAIRTRPAACPDASPCAPQNRRHCQCRTAWPPKAIASMPDRRSKDAILRRLGP